MILAGTLFLLVAFVGMFVGGYLAGYKDRARSAAVDRWLWEAQRRELARAMDDLAEAANRRRTTVIDGGAE